MKQTISANNIEISYQLDGPENSPVIMFSNSLMSNYSMWDAQVAVFSKSYRILRYDQRGHGGTETIIGPYTIEQLADDASALIDTLGIDTVNFVGLSMGGFTAQMFAVKYPEKIASLVLCDTACIMPPHSLWNERISIARNDGIEALMPSTLERWFTPPFHQTGAEQLKKVREMILGTSVEGYIGCAQAIRDMDLCDNLSSIVAPTLILVGEDDPACPVSAAKALYNGIDGSKLVIVPKAAHLPNIEQTTQFNTVLNEWLLSAQSIENERS